MESALYSIGQIAVTLAGFAALLRAFRQRDVGDAHSDPRLRSMVEQGLVVVLLCFLPSVLVAFEFSMGTAVRVIAAAAAAWLLRWLYIMYLVRSAELPRSIARMFRAAFALHVLTFITFTATATGQFGRVEPLYFSGVLLALILVGFAFFAQFQSERS
jgi:hypothetical protein